VDSAATVAVPLQGAIVATTFPNPAALFRRWYSSLVAEPLATSDAASAALAVGSHIITYTVKDKNEDGVAPAQLEALFKSVEHIGAAGGPPDPPPADNRPCVIHVLVANIVTPLDSATLSKASAILEAQAPLQWGRYVEGADSYPQPDPVYHAINKVRYRWLFRRVAPPGPEIELALPNMSALTLIPPSDTVAPPPRLRYTGPLPAELVVGQQYMVILRVDHSDVPTKAHTTTRTVTIAA
jgi:hypothetical protein